MPSNTVSTLTNLETIITAESGLLIKNPDGNTINVKFTDSAIEMFGTQVITTQQPAIPDATGEDPAVLEGTLNMLLATLRVHGLIAP